MSDAWQWCYDPDEAHVIAGLPDAVVTEVERLAGELAELADLGVDITDLGSGPRPGLSGGLRRLNLCSDGWLYFLAAPRQRLILITRIVPPFKDL